MAVTGKGRMQLCVGSLLVLLVLDIHSCQALKQQNAALGNLSYDVFFNDTESRKQEVFAFGETSKHRQFVDSAKNSIYIPEPEKEIPRDGEVKRWQLYAKNTGVIYLQIWRRKGHSNRYILVGQTKYEVKHTGQQTLTLRPGQVSVSRGDVIGFYWPNSGIIAFDAWSCRNPTLSYVSGPSVTQRTIGNRVVFRRLTHANWEPCRQYSVNVIIKQTTKPRKEKMFTFGQASKYRPYVDSAKKSMNIPEPQMQIPRDGEVKRWQLYAKNTGVIYLQIWRRRGHSDKYILVGQTKYDVKHTGQQNLTLRPGQMYVSRGDVIGFYWPNSGIIAFDAWSCRNPTLSYVSGPSSSQRTIGTLVSFRRLTHANWEPCRQYSVNVVIKQTAGETMKMKNKTDGGKRSKVPSSITKHKNDQRNTYVFLKGQQCKERCRIDKPIPENCGCTYDCRIVCQATYRDTLPIHMGSLGILYTLGNSISMAGLGLTFVTHCLFKKLRTIQGKVVMNLAASLFLAKLALQINPFFKGGRLCSLAAVLQHYFCFAAFLWVNVLAFDLFQRVRQLKRALQPSISLAPYLIYAWGLPLSIVVACSVIEFIGALDFKYGNQSHCGVFGDEALVYSLAVPLAFITLVNIIVFMRTACILPREGSFREDQLANRPTEVTEEKKVNPGTDDRPEDPDAYPQEIASYLTPRQELWIYLKVSILMGMAWLSGFLAGFTDQYLSWLSFILLNSLQGIVLCFSVGLNASVMTMCIDKFGRGNSRRYEPMNVREVHTAGRIITDDVTITTISETITVVPGKEEAI